MPPQERDNLKLHSTTSSSSGNVREQEAPVLAAARHLLKPNGSILGREVAQVLRPKFPTFGSAIPVLTTRSDSVAIASIDGRASISHSRIHDFIVQDFGKQLHAAGFGKGDRIALILPNGPELALAIVSVAHWATCVPLSANGAVSELQADLLRAGVDLVIGPYSGPTMRPNTSNNNKTRDSKYHVMDADHDWTVYQEIQDCATALQIPFLGMMPSPDEAGIFRLVAPSNKTYLATPVSWQDAAQPLPDIRSSRSTKKLISTEPNTVNNEVLILFTSGTTGNKKLVPHQLGDMLTAATTIALSWDLSSTDVNCNLMPLFHVGGIVRQVFSPLVSGSAVICCPSFDPSIFWALAAKRAFNWYYAAPTMHQLILQAGRQPSDNNPLLTLEEDIQPRLRMIANAAGGLLPSLAIQLRDTFRANVLPAYGMTECMPVSSPPSSYQLTKPGTSGVAVGPEIAILNTSTGTSLPIGQEGPICVRGDPCFRGYGKIANDPSAAVTDTFMKDGWFNTGDLGRLDEDGYLFITGRSKEVINRGGEIISPMEVEEAITSHPDVKACAAFSAEHDVLQEVVGICIVMENNRPRLDLPSLHEYLGERLAAPKWPQCLVFMDDGLPKSHTNKLLRVKLGSRLGLPELNDAMPPIARTFQATCPPQGTGLDVSIPTQRVTVSAEDVQSKLRQLLVSEDGRNNEKLFVLHHPTRVGSLICHVYNVDRIKAIEVARQHLDFYSIPTHFVDLEKAVDKLESNTAPKATDAVGSILQTSSSSLSGPADILVKAIQELYTDLLKLDYIPGPDANFFHMGGSSMLASQLASKVRKRFNISMNGAEVFHHTSCSELAKLVRHRSEEYTCTTAADDSSEGSKSVNDHNAPFPTKRMAPEPSFLKSVFQLVPMFVVLPIWQVTRYLLFFCFLLKCIGVVPGDRDIGTFVLAYLTFHLSWVTITPLGFILIKWIVIGRYKAGRYPIYSSYYLRWWFVDIMRKLFLRGIWGSNDHLLNCYYRMLGAKIGKGARISLEADVAEFDLVTIGANAAVELATVRGFGVDNGAMILGPVKLGNDASIGAKSVLAPYTSIPDGGHLGPVTSSYDVGKALDVKHARVNRRCLPEPNLFLTIFVGGPITFLVGAFSAIPPLFVLFCMLQYKGQRGEIFINLADLIEWLCDPKRIPFYIGIRVARALLSPFFYMAAAIFVKKTIIGRFEAGPRDTWSGWQLLRHDLVATLFSRKKIQAVTDIIGRHYEFVSVLYRLLGAKVGKRVFWPGNQPVFTGEFDLLEIGDDVVFGSRSSIFCTTVDSCEKVILCAGSNVADNCVVLPGSIIGKNAVLGSNSVCPEGWYLPANSIWFGSKGCEPDCLDKGTEEIKGRGLSAKIDQSKLQFDGDETTLRPFGKAFYQGRATYSVWPLSFIISVTLMIKTFIAAFHALPLLGALHGAAAILYGISIKDRDYNDMRYHFSTFYAAVLFVYFFTNLIRVGLWLGIELTAKWSLMGRRQVGRYNYDTSNYAQRWELYQLIAKIRKFNRLNFLDFFSGTPFLSTYFRLNGGNIGKDCCLYPAGADPFMPEPDLVIMGDRCVVDCASIVCHLNTRGNFELAEITMENDCTLRTRSRIQQAVYMEEGSQLVEKSLAMTGEVIEAGTVWQGGPASFWFSYDKMPPEPSAKTVPYANSDLTEEDEVYDESAKLLSDSNITSYNV